jgi:hypothetical protein
VRALGAIAVSVAIACSRGEPSGDPVAHGSPPPPPSPSPVAPLDATPRDPALAVAAPPVAGPPEPQVARWSARPRDGQPSSPRCLPLVRDRFIQYADLDATGDPRFCVWWNLANVGSADVACWRVELATGAYIGETGVWFAAPVPPRSDDGGSTVALDDHRFATVAKTSFVIRDVSGKVLTRIALPPTPRLHADDVVLGSAEHLIVLDATGRVMRIDPAAGKLGHVIEPPACTHGAPREPVKPAKP